MDQQLQFVLTRAQLDIVLAGLGELPFKHSTGIVQEIVRQFQAQTAPPTQAADVTPND